MLKSAKSAEKDLIPACDQCLKLCSRWPLPLAEVNLTMAAQAAEIVAKNLYSEDAHFVMELVQNAGGCVARSES